MKTSLKLTAALGFLLLNLIFLVLVISILSFEPFTPKTTIEYFIYAVAGISWLILFFCTADTVINEISWNISDKE